MEVTNKKNGELKVSLATVEACDQNYIPLYGLELVAGHNFHSNNNKGFIINETYSRELGLSSPEDAIGSYLSMQGDWAQAAGVQEGAEREFTAPVVGVVKDFHMWSKHQAMTPYLFCNSGDTPSSVSIKLLRSKKKEIPGIIHALNSIWNEISPGTSMQYYLFEDMISDFYAKERSVVRLISMAAIMAIIITCMGLFGLVLFTSKQRSKEVGIRKVMGASNIDVLVVLLLDSIKILGISILVGTPVAIFFLIRWLESFVYRISLHLWMFVLASGIVAVWIWLTTGWQYIKMTKTDPLISIKSE